MSEFRFNVAQLLQELVGATRHHTLDNEALDLGEGQRRLQHISGLVRLTRTHRGVLADVDTRGTLQLECARCLTEFTQQVTFPFSEEFHQTVNVTTGAALPKPEEPDVFLIDETHKLDLGDAMREYTLLNVPMVPLCKEDCKGLCPECGVNLNDEPDHHHAEQEDDRFAALKQLLDD